MTPTKRPARATSYDVALAAGVSQSTVSRCFQSDSPISADTRARVLAIAKELDFRPNALARSLILGRSNVVALIVTEYTLRYNPDVLYVIGETLNAHNAKLLLVPVKNDGEVHEALQGAMEFPLDGLIACAELPQQDILSFQSHGVPVVMFNRSSHEKRVDCVATDNTAGGREVAARLHEAGHRRFLCIGGPASAPVSAQRIDGFVSQLQEQGAGAVDVIHSDFSYRGAYESLVALGKKSARNYDAIFCANDQLALGALDACRFALRMNVPDDLSIVGFDDIEESDRPIYRLTTMKQPIKTLASHALQLLASRRLNPKLNARRMTFPAVLIRRLTALMEGE